jgi:hypothetical protein
MNNRKDPIINYWQIMRKANPKRFDYETSRLTGYELVNTQNWEGKLFNSVVEAIEVTALQRCCERWEP